MKKNSEEGGVACGICSISLQRASFGFGIADVTHGVVGVAVLLSMIIKKENDEKDTLDPEKITGYAHFVKICPLWVMHLLLGSFILQVTLGMILCLGASNRSFILCTFWVIASFLASPLIPMSYCLLGLGRLYQWAVVVEWMSSLDSEDIQHRKKNTSHGNRDILYVGNAMDGDEDDNIN